MEQHKPIEDLRKDYRLKKLEEIDVDDNPIAQFGAWWDEALQSKVPEPNAMTLATSNREGRPSARIVLLKGFDDSGFKFYTNYNSRKGNDLTNSHSVALVFLWKELERQVRIEGTAGKLQEGESDAYFNSRPRESQIGAWSSPQSRAIESRDVLERNVKMYTEKFGDGDIPRPEHWGGFLVKPVLIEFWQGREGRMHDRLQYTLQASHHWKIDRLAP